MLGMNESVGEGGITRVETNSSTSTGNQIVSFVYVRWVDMNRIESNQITSNATPKLDC